MSDKSPVEAPKMPKVWASLEIDVPSDQEDLACWLLMQAGAQGCQVNPADGANLRIRATFGEGSLSDEQWQEVRTTFAENGLAGCLRTMHNVEVPEEDWLAKWKEGFEPFRVGTKFLICPSWYLDEEALKELPPIAAELAEGRFKIYIEPGMAFGTGLHATTQFCLRAMENFPPKGKVLDVGTGSGILAMAALMLEPAAEVVAIEIDPVAVDFARTDFELNGLDGRIELITGSTNTVKGRKFDVLLSNLTCEDIILLLDDYRGLLNPGGVVLCAGILAEKLPLLEKALGNPGPTLRIIQSETVGQWVGVVLQRG